MQLLSTRRRRLATAAASFVLVSVPLVSGLAAQAADTATGQVNTTGAALKVRSAPTTASSVVGTRADGARVTIVCQTYGQTVSGTYGTSKVWDKIKSGGYVSDAFIKTGSDGLVAPLCKGTTTPPAPTQSAKVKATIAAAKGMLGKHPYSWGGGNANGPTKGICCSPSGIDDRNTVGFDCSGFMEYVFHQGAGLRLSSTSRSQYADGPRVSISQIKAGDMVFWSGSSKTASGIHHVALYIGDGKIAEANRVSGPDIRIRAFSRNESGVMPYVVRPIH
ncbi:NlpC/P60 family protein [Pedococcus sp. KACC 23699]|uniref:NlpC/P60 family protein n=1 Tax=Pedococcus sp. KACC 23699 TaxID=3149228 RepID=A0AAU7JXY5_9MICO